MHYSLINQRIQSTHNHCKYFVTVHSFFLAFVWIVWQDFEREDLHFCHINSKSTSDFSGTRDLTTVL